MVPIPNRSANRASTQGRVNLDVERCGRAEVLTYRISLPALNYALPRRAGLRSVSCLLNKPGAPRPFPLSAFVTRAGSIGRGRGSDFAEVSRGGNGLTRSSSPENNGRSLGAARGRRAAAPRPKSARTAERD